MRPWLKFLAAAFLWAALGRLALSIPMIQRRPLTFAALWLVAFVWITFFTLDGWRTASRQTVGWVVFLASLNAVAAAAVFFSNY